MNTTPERRPAPAAADCPPRYSSLRDARRGAYWKATKRSEKPVPPVHCTRCDGWHLAAGQEPTP